MGIVDGKQSTDNRLKENIYR